jgi:hypothetical protein
MLLYFYQLGYMRFKKYLKTAVAFSILVIFVAGCKKTNDTPVSPSLKILQNYWTYISTRIYFPDGNSYKLLGDFKDFRKDGYSINISYGLSGRPQNDTATYKLLYDSLIEFREIVNGIQNPPDTAFIRTINDTLLVFDYRSNGIIIALDSLKK